MKRFLTGARRAVRPDGLGRMGTWLIAGALTFGIAPVSVHAQDTGGQGGGIKDGAKQYGQQGTGQTAPIAPATLFGLPSKKGHVQWPLALRILSPGSEAKALRDQLELVLYIVASQAAEGQVSQGFIDLGLQAVSDLRQSLQAVRREYDRLPIHGDPYRDAMRFLDRAERGLNRIKNSEASPERTPKERSTGRFNERRTVTVPRSRSLGIGGRS